jgi:hypothetical protein
MRASRLAALGIAAAVALAAAPAAHAQLKLEWNVEGYYRTRAVSVSNLADEPRAQLVNPKTGAPIVMPDIKSTSYMTQRLRLNPQLRLENIAKLNFEITALDDVLWGDNNGISTAPLFSVNGSNQYFLGGPESSTVQVTRAWAEFQVPVGLMRVGRMPSHWGMGLLANGGGSGNWDPLTPPGKPRRHVQDYYFDEDFGDNHFGSTNDRVLFATRPLTIIRTIQKKADTLSNFLVAYAFDKLSESPLLLGEPDRLSRPFGQQGFLSRGEKQDDVNEHVIVVAYSNPDWDKVRYTDELKLGTYWVFRTQDQGFTEPRRGIPDKRLPDGTCVTNDDNMRPVPNEECVTKDEGSLVWIGDIWYRIRYGFWYSEAEAVHIGGETTGGVPFPGPNQRKKASISGAVWRGGYLTPMYDGVLEIGYASGDDNLGDLHFKQRPLHPDYNVGLILFEEITRERSARAFGPRLISSTSPDGARGFFSNGGVVNAKYLAPKGRFRPGFGGFELVGQLIFAWVDQYDLVGPNVFVCPSDKIKYGAGGKPESCNYSKYLGTEVDLAVKSRFARDLMDFSLELGYLRFGDILKNYTSTGQENPNHPTGSFTIQARIAMVF